MLKGRIIFVLRRGNTDNRTHEDCQKQRLGTEKTLAVWTVPTVLSLQQ